MVDAGGLKPNIGRRFERLGSAWIQAKRGITDALKGQTRLDWRMRLLLRLVSVLEGVVGQGVRFGCLDLGCALLVVRDDC